MTRHLPPSQVALLRTLKEAGGRALLAEIAARAGIDQSQIAAAAVDLQAVGWVRVEEEPYEEVALLDAGRAFLDSGEKLPELRMAETLAREGPLVLPDLAARIGLDPAEAGKALRFLFSKGLARKRGGALEASGEERASGFEDAALLESLRGAEGGVLELAAGDAERLEGPLAELRAREFVKVRSRVRRFAELTEQGREAVQAGIAAKEERSLLDPELLRTGAWREAVFRPYDVSLDAAEVFPAKEHPMRRILEEARRAFLHMGFEEIRGPHVESAFWDFDALFQPQDHPAREMQDTFYVNRPARFELPERSVVERVRATHENGGETGSIGWRYRWDEETARRVVLRTHTTAATVAALYENPKPPRKVFLVGRVFRREKIDYKHLPEFHQVDGIIIDSKATLSALLGTLAEFYRQMGFRDVKFRPDFFPYTEPSVGAFVRMPGREGWFELGGAGIFRPEVTRPFGCEVPVLAWGLGLERLAMMRYGLTDIRKLFWSDVRWLEETPLCR
ncbi:MAG: phenylalanine--tRNA ligase subunit alpha [Candidatus Eisenbacteria bacterium]|nr:phenylalanine--tRNA ligase subunit alpha [Candidatus Eisenbacteria bacterium]